MADERPDVTIPVPGDGAGGEQPTEGEMPAEDRFSAAEQTVLVGMTQGFGAANNRRIDGSDYMAETSRMQHQARLDRLSQADSFAYRTAIESGSGRTRVESNTPASGQTSGGT